VTDRSARSGRVRGAIGSDMSGIDFAATETAILVNEVLAFFWGESTKATVVSLEIVDLDAEIVDRL